MEEIDWRSAALDTSQLDEQFLADLQDAAESIDAYIENTCGFSRQGEVPEEVFESPGAVREVATYLGTDEAGARCFLDAVDIRMFTATDGDVPLPAPNSFSECGLDISTVPMFIDLILADNDVTESEAQCLLVEFERTVLVDGDLSDAEVDEIESACGVPDPRDAGG